MRCKLASAAVVALAPFLTMATTLAGVVYDPASGLTRLTADEPFVNWSIPVSLS
jgi:hypothetical protein